MLPSILGIACYVLACAASLVSAKRILVVKESADSIDNYSAYLEDLKGAGFDVVVENFQDMAAFNGKFDDLVLLGPTTKVVPDKIRPHTVLGYVKKGANLVLALSPYSPEAWRDFAREFDVDYDDRGNFAVDHTHYASVDTGAHNVLSVPLRVPYPFVTDTTRAAQPSLLYQGAAHRVGPSPLATSLVHAFRTTIGLPEPGKTKGTPVYEGSKVSGTQASLVSAFQTTANARVLFTGPALFTDAFASANRAVAADLTQWTFQRRGVLRIDGAAHTNAKTQQTPELYRVKDTMHYALNISQYDASTGWTAYDASDVQFEFTMLDPHVLQTFEAPSGGQYGVDFVLPDRHGVFTLRTDYRRPGWSSIKSEQTVSVTPPRHDEYDRFITGALPWYGGAFSVTVASFVFIALWLLL